MENLTVLYIQRRPHRAGAQVSLAQFLPHLPQTGITPLVAVEGEGFLTEHCASYGIPFFVGHFPPWRSPLSWTAMWPFFYRRIRKFLKTEAPRGVDVVHGNNVGEGGLTVTLAKGLSCVSVVHVRDGFAGQERFLKYRGGEANGVIAISKRMYEQATAWKGIRHLELIHDCVDASFFAGQNDTASAALSHDMKRVNILVVGTSDLRKGWKTVAQALATVSKSVRERTRWIFLGRTRDDEIRAIEAILDGCSPPVDRVFLGHREAVASLYRNVDLVVMPSHRESFGRTLIEAGLFSRPLVSSRVGAAEDVVTGPEYGYLFEPDNSDALAAVLADALRDESRQEKGMRLHERVVSEFACHAHNSALRAFYQRLLSSPNRV